MRDYKKNMHFLKAGEWENAFTSSKNSLSALTHRTKTATTVVWNLWYFHHYTSNDEYEKQRKHLTYRKNPEKSVAPN